MLLGKRILGKIFFFFGLVSTLLSFSSIPSLDFCFVPFLSVVHFGTSHCENGEGGFGGGWMGALGWDLVIGMV